MSKPLVYAERMNVLNGEPGGGKTWVALLACAKAIRKGLHVIFIDFEDHAGSTVARLRALGCTDDQIRRYFHYVRPTSGMEPEHMEFLLGQIAVLPVALVVIDSIGELMAMQGVKPNDDDAVARLYRAIPRRLADAGPGVLMLDHVPKNNEHAPMFGIGSQRKKAAIDGAAYMVETVKAFSADTPGKVILRTAKDRNGNFVVGRVAAEIDVTPEGAGGLNLFIHPPEMATDGTHTRKTGIMRKVSDFLHNAPGGVASTARIESSVGSKNYLRGALKDMVDEGWLLAYAGDRGAVMYQLLHQFDELATPPTQRNAGAPEDEF
jgi:hypothetical protein